LPGADQGDEGGWGLRRRSAEGAGGAALRRAELYARAQHGAGGDGRGGALAVHGEPPADCGVQYARARQHRGDRAGRAPGYAGARHAGGRAEPLGRAALTGAAEAGTAACPARQARLIECAGAFAERPIGEGAEETMPQDVFAEAERKMTKTVETF